MLCQLPERELSFLRGLVSAMRLAAQPHLARRVLHHVTGCLAQMQEAARRIGKPNAGFDVTDAIVKKYLA